MAQQTKAQLIDELVRLRQHCEHIERELASYKAAEHNAPKHNDIHQPRDERAISFSAAVARAREMSELTGKSHVVRRIAGGFMAAGA